MSQFETNILNLHQEQGKLWLKSLPELIANAAKDFGLSNLEPLKDLTYNYVLKGVRGSQPIILKLGLDIECEVDAIKAYENYGGVRLLARSRDALLLECVTPGFSLSSYFPDNENESVLIICETIKKLHEAPIPQNNNFPHLRDWLKNLDKDYPQIDKNHLQKARILRDKLLLTSSDEVLLHGDLHHNNILRSNEGWVVIDPKGVIGNPLYDLAVFIRNPIPQLLENSKAESIIKNRVELFAKIMNLDEDLINEWCYLQSVLSIIWAIEDRGSPDYFIRVCLHSCFLVRDF